MAQSATVPRISSRTAHIALPTNITISITKNGSKYASTTAFHPIFCCTITSTSSPTFISAIGDGLWVALDGVQDPGNLGTIIRTCDWFGTHHIVCSRETADCYNPKVVQATMGALARVHLHYVEDLSNTLKQYKSAGYPIYGTLLEGTNMYHEGSIPTKAKGIIVMGNEGKGLTAEVRKEVTHPLLIPSYPAGMATSESLNVGIATAIVLAEFRRDNN